MYVAQYPKVVMPWSHHLGKIGQPIEVNPIVHPKGQGGRLFLPPNGWVGGDQNWKCIHEGKVPHPLVKG